MDIIWFCTSTASRYLIYKRHLYLDVITHGGLWQVTSIKVYQVYSVSTGRLVAGWVVVMDSVRRYVGGGLWP